MKKRLFIKQIILIAMMTFCACGSAVAANTQAKTLDQLKKEYVFDHKAPLNITIADTKDFPAYTKYHFFYDSPNGGRVPAILMLPKSRVKPMKANLSTVPGSYPAVFFMHFHVADKSLADIFATWPGYGIAVMAIDGVFRGEREDKDKDILMPDPFVSAANMKLQVRDILRGFDVLAGWKGIDPGRIGYFGISMGALTGTVATALDPRIKSIDLADGGADFSAIFDNSDYGSLMEIKKFMVDNNTTKDQFMSVFETVDPASFAPLIGDRPVLLQNGKQDTTISVPAMNKLHDLVPASKKKIIWYDSGHILPVDKLVHDSLLWFKKTL